MSPPAPQRMTPDRSRPEPARASPARCAAEIAGLVAGVGLAAVWLAHAIARVPGDAEVAGGMRFVAFAFAMMGLAWLAAPFVVGRFGWRGLFRWAAAIDAAGVSLFVGSLVSGVATWRQGLMLYAILACFATAQLAVMWLTWRVSASSGATTVAGVALAVVACTSLVWGHLPDRLTRPSSTPDRAVLWTVRYVNPLLAANDAINPPISFDWAHHGRMYSHYGIIGEARLLGLPSWPIACAFHLAAAAVLAGLARVLPPRRAGRSETPHR